MKIILLALLSLPASIPGTESEPVQGDATDEALTLDKASSVLADLTAAAPQCYASASVDLGDKELRKMLKEVRVVLQSIAGTDWAVLRPDLKSFAEAYSREPLDDLAFHGLYSLWCLGEPSDYFLQLSEAHWESSPWLARHAMQVLTFTPSEEIVEKMEGISEKSGHKAVHSIAKTARILLGYSKHYQPMTVEEKFGYLQRFLPTGMSFDIPYRHNWDYQSGLGPYAVWSRVQLGELSKQHPAEVAALIAGIDQATVPALGAPTEEEELNKVLTAYREYLSGFVHETCAAYLSDLKDQ